MGLSGTDVRRRGKDQSLIGVWEVGPFCQLADFFADESFAADNHH
jgi:hypothetical protein